MLSERRAHATLPVGDLTEAKRFWGERLGFGVLEENPIAVLYRAGEGSVFAVTTSTGRATGAHTQLGFTTPDIEAEVADLKARGVVFEEYDTPGFRTEDSIARSPAGRAAWFKDPAGNLIGLIEFGREAEG
jgi:catechol 2,3-dioxygenase-like lactoylglutathione lyase family enzyme